MNIVDLTLPLGPDTPVAEGDPAITLTRIHSHGADGYQVTHICLGSHSGTHLDAPRHFLPNGATLDTIPVSRFIRTGWVIDVRPPELAGEREATDGAAAPESGPRRPQEPPAVSPLAAPLTTFAPGGALAAPNNPLPLVTAVSELAAGTPPLGTAAPIVAPRPAPSVPRVTSERLAERLRETAIEPGDFLLLWTGGALARR